MSKYQVLFNGVTTQDSNVARVEQAVARELGIDRGKAKRLFNGRTVVLASQLSRDEALDLQLRLEGVGAISRIKDLTPKKPAPHGYEQERADSDSTLGDLTAAHVDCARCGHMQLEASHCANCGVDLEALFRKRRKADLLMAKQLRDHRSVQDQQAQAQAKQAAGDALAAAGPIAADPGDRHEEKVGLFSRLFKRSA